jgi:curved DNA-binding protein CbpA
MASATPDLLELLELPHTAPRETVRTSYLQAALRTHPDNNCGDPEAARRMIELQEAWERYQKAKRRDHRSPHDEGGFTQFGVGCSFDDSLEEHIARSIIMEQASRGVLPRRALADAGVTGARDGGTEGTHDT